MKFSREEMRHIADLARLGLSEEELELYGRQMTAVTGYIDRLQELEIAPASCVVRAYNVWREDEVIDWSDEEREAAFIQAARKDDLIKVKRVLS